jgi:SAM-dependent methyltransferase|tara:strand:- start:1022 stop:1819 length:798 start_codon:yes stop_codon:yes gene_type:complete
MKVNNWHYDIKDICEYPVGIKMDGESILSNAVNAANYDLLMSINEDSKILEIGCGANSYLLSNIKNKDNWDAIDVYEADARGRKCIATKLGSVHDIPFSNESFDFVLANQSIEHWHEYGVSLGDGVNEILRVLKVGGTAHINFPFFLHGHPWFVKGDMTSILNLFEPAVCKIDSITAYQDSVEPDYIGWRRCKFPDFYVKKLHTPDSSFVVELAITKMRSSSSDKKIADIKFQPLKRQSSFRRNIIHGLDVLAWKVMTKLTSFLK